MRFTSKQVRVKDRVVSNVYFKGRTVFVLLLMTMVASVLVTLTIGDQVFWAANGKQASVSAAAASEGNGLNKKEESKINAVLGLIETKYFKDIDRDELLDGAVRGMMESLDDPYSVYMEKDVAKQFSESIEGSFSGMEPRLRSKKAKSWLSRQSKAHRQNAPGCSPRMSFYRSTARSWTA